MSVAGQIGYNASPICEDNNCAVCGPDQKITRFDCIIWYFIFTQMCLGELIWIFNSFNVKFV